MIFTDTIVALSSGRLPAGVAVLRFSGPKVRFVFETMFGSVPPPRLMRLGSVRSGDGQLIDRALAVFFPGPESFSGEDIGEFHLHGGRAVVAAAIEAMLKIPSCRLAEAGEFTRRAFLNGKVDLVQAEGLADLIAAETEAQRRLAAGVAEGRQGEIYARWRQRLIATRAAIEASLDFSDEEDVPEVSDSVWEDLPALREEMSVHAGDFHRGEIVRDGFDVVLVGAPNAGKSSLLNALARREVAIVTDEPGTTRDTIEVALDLGGVKIRLTDTAGLREGAGTVESLGIARARARAQAADLVLVLEDLSGPRAERLSFPAMLRVGTKSDLAGGPYDGYDCMVSVRTGNGLDDLLSRLERQAMRAIGPLDFGIPLRMRHVVLIREAAEAIGRAEALASIELVAEELRQASDALGRISGKIDVEDILDDVFGRFCIGK